MKNADNRPSKKLLSQFQHQLNRLNNQLDALASHHPELAYLQRAETRAEQSPEVDRLLHGTAMLMADMALSMDEHLQHAAMRLLAMKNPDLYFWCPKSKVTPWPASLQHLKCLPAGTSQQGTDETAKEKTFSTSWEFHRQGIRILRADIQAYIPGKHDLSSGGIQTLTTHHLILDIQHEQTDSKNTTFCCHIQGLSLFAWELWEAIHQAAQTSPTENKAVKPSGLGSATQHLLWRRNTRTPWGNALLEDFFNCPESLRFFEFALPAFKNAAPTQTLCIPLLLNNDSQLLKLHKKELLALLLPDPVLWSNVFVKALKPVVIESDSCTHHIEVQGAAKVRQRIVRIQHLSGEGPQGKPQVQAQTLAFHHEEGGYQSSVKNGALLMLHNGLPIGYKLSMNALCTETPASTREGQSIKAYQLLQAQSHTLSSLCKLDASQFLELMLTHDHTDEGVCSNLSGAFLSLQVDRQHKLIRERASFIPMSAHRFTFGLLPEKLLPLPVSALACVIERWLAGYCASFEMISVQITHAATPARILYEGPWKISPAQNVFCSAPGHPQNPR